LKGINYLLAAYVSLKQQQSALISEAEVNGDSEEWPPCFAEIFTVQSLGA
jgi:hypothetical protein